MTRKTIYGLVFLMILFICGKALGYFLVPLITASTTVREVNEIAHSTKLIFTVQLIVGYLFNFGVGLFLINQAKQVSYHRGLWFCLGVIFGFNALILFYLLKLLKDKTTSNSNSNDDQLLDN